jgi:hypothetical protein
MQMTLNQFSALEELVHSTDMADAADPALDIGQTGAGALVVSKNRRAGGPPTFLGYVTAPGVIHRAA